MNLNDAVLTKWFTPSLKMAGAKFISFDSFDFSRRISASTDDGKSFTETVAGEDFDGAATRLARKVRQHLDFGKKRRAFRTKLRNIGARRM